MPVCASRPVSTSSAQRAPRPAARAAGRRALPSGERHQRSDPRRRSADRGGRAAGAAVRARARRARRGAGHDRRRRRPRRAHRHPGHQPLRRDVRVADADGGRAGRASTCWSSICRTSAAATTRTSGRWCWRWARRRARGVAVVVLDRPNPLGGVAIEGGTVQRALRVVRRAGRRPGPPRPDDRRDRAAGGAPGCRGAAPRFARPLDCDLTVVRDARLAARDDLRRDRAAVGDAVAEHADARHRARLSGAVPVRGDQPVRGARHDAAVRDRRARRSSTATRWAAALAATQPAGRALPAARRSGRRSTSSRGQVVRRRAAARRPTAAAFRPYRTGVALLAAARKLAPRRLPLADRAVRVRRRSARDRSADRQRRRCARRSTRARRCDDLAAPFAPFERAFAERAGRRCIPEYE